MELTGPFPPCPVSHPGDVYSKNGKCLPVPPVTSGCMAYRSPTPT